MNILDVMETCTNPSLSVFLPVVKNVLLIIQIVVPILLIIAMTIQFVSLSVNPEDKKGFRKLLNKVIAAIIVFMVPVLVNVIMGVVGESTEFSNCWNNAGNENIVNTDDNYIEIDEDRPRSGAIDNPDNYE